MKQQYNAFVAEVLKNRHSPIIWITFIAFSLAPIFGAVFMYLMKDGGTTGLSGAFKMKAELMSFESNWNSLLGLLSQAVGIGGVLIFGFVASWLFGREFSDGTSKDLLSLPISRAKIINAKFIYYIIWCTALVIVNLLLGILFGYLLNIPGRSIDMFTHNLKVYFITTFLIIMLNTPIAFFAIYGKGFLAPLGVVALLLVVAQIFGVLGFGNYFPWAVPGIYAGSGGVEMAASLNYISFGLIILMSIIGYFGTIFWWKYTDQTK